MITSPQRINPLFFVLIIVLISIIFGLQWLNSAVEQKQMVAFCENRSMSYYYHDTNSFYCIGGGLPIRIVEFQIG